MKVLVTGGYGFIGSHVAERFNKEGHQVYILDNLATGHEKNISFKHKSYKYNVQDRKCEEIFRNNKFDVVVHLAAQVSVDKSVEDPCEDANINLAGLVNMLHFSGKYLVKKFIFASSAAVYGNNMSLPLKEDYECEPTSPYGISKYAGEFYCKKWSEVYGLNTLCFRLSNVYGPCQKSVGEGSVIASFINRILSGKEIQVHGDGEQTRDFIYVEDVADAIYRSIDCDYTGVMNLSTNTECSINNLVETLRSKSSIKEVVYKSARKKDISRSCLDNSRTKRELDWVPMYTLDKGLEKTIRWYSKNIDLSKSEAAATSVADKGSMFSVLLPYLENILAFLFVILLTNLTRYNSDFRVFDFRLLYIILMGIMYGTRQSTIAVGLATVLYVISSLDIGRDPISLIYDPNSLLQVAIYILVGLAIGYTIDKKNRDILFRELRLQNTEEKYSFINEMYNETRIVKEELQNQIVNSEDSFGKIYSITREISSLQPEDIFNASVSVLENVMKSNSISIYTVNKTGQFLRLAASSKDTNINIPKSLRVSDNPLIKDMMDKGEIFVNNKLDPYLPMLMAPIMDNSKVIAIASIHNVKFENLTLYYENLFKIVVGLISSSLSRAYRFDEATYGERYINDTRIMNWQNFNKIVQTKKQAKRTLSINYTILNIGKPQMDLQEISHELSNTVRETDYIGMGKSGNFYILLSNTDSQDAEVVIKRLEKMNIAANIISEENGNE